jgi:rare lipoprotein A
MRVAALCVVAALGIAGCGHKRSAIAAPPAPSLPPSTPVTVQPGQVETGLASWYGHPYHGRRASNGEIYDMEKMTAAHRTLPFNTWVRVYNLDNNKTTEVRIIDRGPFIEGRIIDLSHAAAAEIAMIGPGTARVRIEIISAPPGAAQGGLFAIQVGAYRVRANAEQVRTRMEQQYGTARLVERAEDPGVWRVLVGAETTEEGANALAERIRRDSVEKTAGLIVRLDSN